MKQLWGDYARGISIIISAYGVIKKKGNEIRSLPFMVEQNYTKSNKFIRDFEKIVEYIHSFPEVREFINEEGDVGT